MKNATHTRLSLRLLAAPFLIMSAVIALGCVGGATLGENEEGGDTYLDGKAPTSREQAREDAFGNPLEPTCDFRGSLAVDHRTGTTFVVQNVVDKWCEDVTHEDVPRKTLYAVHSSARAYGVPVLDLTGLSDLRMTFPKDKILLMAEGEDGNDHLIFLAPGSYRELGRLEPGVRYHGTRTSPSRRYLAVADNTTENAPIHIIDTKEMTLTKIPHGGDWLEAMWTTNPERPGDPDRLVAMVFYNPFCVATDTVSEPSSVRLLSWTLTEEQDVHFLKADEGRQEWGENDFDITLDHYNPSFGFGFSWVGLSPDGKTAVFPLVARRPGTETERGQNQLLVVDLVTGTLSYNVEEARGPVGFSPDSTTIVAHDMSKLVLVDVASQERVDVHAEPEHMSYFVTREDNFVAVTHAIEGRNFWIYDMDAGEMTRIDTAHRVGLNEFIVRDDVGEIWMVSEDRLHVVSLEAATLETIELDTAPQHIGYLKGKDTVVLDDMNSNMITFFDPDDRVVTGQTTLPLGGDAPETGIVRGGLRVSSELGVRRSTVRNLTIGEIVVLGR